MNVVLRLMEAAVAFVASGGGGGVGWRLHSHFCV